jgi:leucyl-tRNA synthetase
MEYMNAVRANGRAANRAEVEPLVPLVAPFAPHMAEELWEQLGHDRSIFEGANWPAYDPAKTVADTVEFIVQVNGKLRGRMPLPRGIGEAAAKEAALADENVRKFVDNRQVRVIFVPDRLVNLVVS